MSFNDFYSKEIKEKKMSIQRFSGSNEMSDAELLTFLHRLQSVAQDGNLDLATNDKASMTEKFDGSPANWGLNGEFFMESANSGEVTTGNIEKFNNPYTVHFYEAFKFLEAYEPFQERLKKAHEYAGEEIKFISEMFPVLTHKGDELGNIVFASTKYNKEKLGEKGAFMIFDVKVKQGESWTDPADDIKQMLIDIVRSTDDPQWKTFYIEQDGKLSGTLQFEFAGIKDWISSPEKLAATVALLRKKNDPNKEVLKDLIGKIRPSLQKQLDAYAEKTSSSLAKSGTQSPIEGVVLKVTLPDGPTFIKGTSQIFHDINKGTWGTRKELGEIEKTLTGQFLKDVIGLRTEQPAALNRAIAEIAKTFNSDKQGEERYNDFTLQLYKKLANEGVTNDAEQARNKAAAHLSSARQQLQTLVAQWNETKKNVDPDSVAKTEHQLKYLSDMIESLEKKIVDTQYTGDAYMVYLLRLIIGRRIDSAVKGGQEIDELAGGVAQGKTLEQIAQKHGLQVEDIKSEFLAGMEHEMEHTSDHEIAGEIAKDHLFEDPHYYSNLKQSGIDEGGLDELDISNMLAKAKGVLSRKPKEKELPPGYYKDPTVDDLHQHQRFIAPVNSASSDIDDNLPDQYLGTDPNDDIHRRAVNYLRTGGLDTDPELWEEGAEEFEEDEILDERKFEKVKMARNILQKMGYPKAYQRNDKGKYVFRSKHIRKLMTKLGYTFSAEKGRWIMNDTPPVEKEVEPQVAPEPTPVPVGAAQGTVKSSTGKKAIIWVGRAQPWHKGHDVLVQQGIAQMKSVGASMVFIMLVKGAATGDDKTKNPMDFEQQIHLIDSIYSSNNSVDISSIPVPTGSIVDIFVTASKQNVIIKGWLAGSDRVAGYKRQYDAFKTDKYKAEFEQKTKPGTPYPVDGDVQFIDVGREEDNTPKPTTKDAKAAASAEKSAKLDAEAKAVASSPTPIIPVQKMSGSLARALAPKVDFDHWFKEICSEKYLTNDSAKFGYREAYAILGGAPAQPQVTETFAESFKNDLKNIFFGE